MAWSGLSGGCNPAADNQLDFGVLRQPHQHQQQRRTRRTREESWPTANCAAGTRVTGEDERLVAGQYRWWGR